MRSTDEFPRRENDVVPMLFLVLGDGMSADRRMPDDAMVGGARFRVLLELEENL